MTIESSSDDNSETGLEVTLTEAAAFTRCPSSARTRGKPGSFSTTWPPPRTTVSGQDREEHPSLRHSRWNCCGCGRAGPLARGGRHSLITREDSCGSIVGVGMRAAVGSEPKGLFRGWAGSRARRHVDRPHLSHVAASARRGGNRPERAVDPSPPITVVARRVIA